MLRDLPNQGEGRNPYYALFARNGFTHAADSEMERIQDIFFNLGVIDTTLGHLL